MGGDASLLKGIMKALIEMDEARILLGQQPTLDHAFIDEHTAGYSALYDDLRQCCWAELEQDSGLTRSQMEDWRTAITNLARRSFVMDWVLPSIKTAPKTSSNW